MTQSKRPNQNNQKRGAGSDGNKKGASFTQSANDGEFDGQPQHHNYLTSAEPSYKRELDISEFIVSVLTLLAALVAAFFSGYLVYVSRDAAEDAHIAYTSTQRPFITVKELRTEFTPGIKPGKVGEPGIPQDYWNFTPVFENSGNTLTKNLRIYSIAAFKELPAAFGLGPKQSLIGPIGLTVDTPEDPDDVIASSRDTMSAINTVIGPHSSSPYGFIGITPENLKPTSPSFFLYGIASYNDIFPETSRHETKFCFVVSGIPTVGQQKPSVGLCSHWNCTDDECKDDKKTYADEKKRLAK